MTETVRYSKAMLEDLAIGNGTRQIRLANQGVYTLHEIHIGGLLQTSIRTVPTVNGAALLTASAMIQSAWRVWGVTAKVTVGFGITGGLTGLLIGDGSIVDRWTSSALALALNTETDQGDFADPSLMIYPTATDVIVTAVGGLFDSTGAIELAVHYSILRHPS